MLERAPITLGEKSVRSLGFALAPLSRDGAIVDHLRRRVQWAADLGYGAVTIDAAHPQTRPRSLDRSARRDLASLLRRLELTSAGVDLWIPPSHFAKPEHQNRALDAAAAAALLAADLAALAGGQPLVHLALPPNLPADARHEITTAAEHAGAMLVDYNWPPPDAARDAPATALGIDPALVMGAGADPIEAIATNLGRLGASRLSDWSLGVRVPPGRGDLDLAGYAAAVAASGLTAPMIVDLRGLARPAAEGERFARQWAGV